MVFVRGVPILRYFNLYSQCVSSSLSNDVKHIQERTSKAYRRQSLKNHLKFFKGCPPQILVGSFLNVLSHVLMWKSLIILPTGNLF